MCRINATVIIPVVSCIIPTYSLGYILALLWESVNRWILKAPYNYLMPLTRDDDLPRSLSKGLPIITAVDGFNGET
jgi:hypothetical protein